MTGDPTEIGPGSAGAPRDPSAADEDRLAELVEKGLEELDEGRTPDISLLCAEAPELAPRVAAALGLDVALARLHASARGQDPLVGRRLAGRYQLEARIGAGAMGAVYRATDLDLDREVAVKVLSSLATGHADPVARQRFEREAKALAGIRHPHVVAVFDRGAEPAPASSGSGDGGKSDASLPFLVMELLAGQSLASQLREQSEAENATRDVRQLVRQAAEIADGLAAAHAIGIVHRDVKPSNVIVTDDGRAVLLDFGIAVKETDPELTVAGTALGTPWYMAPEAARGDGLDVRTDVYGVGATLYHLLSGLPPYDDEPRRVLARVLTEDPPPLTRLVADLHGDVAAIVEKAMLREPAGRYESAAALAADLRAFLEHRPVTARAAGPARRLLRSCRRRPARALAWFSGAVTVCVLGIALPLLGGIQRERAHAEHARRLARLPALLSIEGHPDQRVLVESGEREAQLRELDELLALRPEDTATRALRAAVRLDAGEIPGARADAEQLARLDGSPCLTEFAARHRQLSDDAIGLGSLDLSELPEPTTSAGRFVCALQALRERTTAGYERAEQLLAACDPSWLPGRDLRLIALLSLDRIDEALTEARALEAIYGGPTARTRHAIGVALIGKRRYDEALPAIRAALEIRDDRHGPWNNLGLALLRSGEIEAARSALLRAHEIRPWLTNTRQLLAQLEADAGNYDEARRWARLVPEIDVDGTRWKRPYEQAQIAMKEAFGALTGGTLRAEPAQGPARELAVAAVAAFDAALAAEPPESRIRSLRQSQALCACLADGKDDELVARAVGLLLPAPLNPAQLRNLAVTLPVESEAAQLVALMRLTLLELAAELAPGQPRFRADANEWRRLLKVPAKNPPK